MLRKVIGESCGETQTNKRHAKVFVASLLAEGSYCSNTELIFTFNSISLTASAMAVAS